MITLPDRVRSADGTTIAFHRGGLGDGSENAPLAAELAATHTVINYSRRARAE